MYMYLLISSVLSRIDYFWLTGVNDVFRHIYMYMYLLISSILSGIDYLWLTGVNDVLRHVYIYIVLIDFIYSQSH